MAGNKINTSAIPNSDAYCLLENWYEERETKRYDENGIGEMTAHKSKWENTKHGHKGLITTDFTSGLSSETTHNEAYKKYDLPVDGRRMTVRQRAIEKMLYEKMMKEQEAKETPEEAAEEEEFKDEYITIYHQDYDVEGVKDTWPVPSMAHDYKTEQAATHWLDHKLKIQGVSQIKTLDTPFRKNDAFSKPIGEYWDEAKPYERENIPYM